MTIDSSEINSSKKEEPAIPSKKRYTATQLNEFTQDEHIGQLLFIAQTYLGKPLSSNDVGSILEMYNSLELSIDYLDYIMETCVSDGMKSLSEIEKHVTELYSKGIKDIKTLKASSKKASNIQKKILDAFGITGRLPGRDEKNIIAKWQNDYSFSEELMIEACHRTISKIHTPSFEYANKILEEWHNTGVSNMEDVKKADEEFAKKTSEKKTEKKKAGVSAVRHKAGQNISNRKYDFESLEKKLTK